MTPRGSKSRKEIIKDNQPGFFKSMLFKEKEKQKKEAVQLC